jgi:predicted nucleic acid-binding protein
MKYLLDTNTCIRYMNGRSQSIADKLNALNEAKRNAAHVTVDWHFTAADARIKLKRLYPVLKERFPA